MAGDCCRKRLKLLYLKTVTSIEVSCSTSGSVWVQYFDHQLHQNNLFTKFCQVSIWIRIFGSRHFDHFGLFKASRHFQMTNSQVAPLLLRLRSVPPQRFQDVPAAVHWHRGRARSGRALPANQWETLHGNQWWGATSHWHLGNTKKIRFLRHLVCCFDIETLSNWQSWLFQMWSRGAGSFKMIKGFDVLNYDEKAGAGPKKKKTTSKFRKAHLTFVKASSSK